MGACWEDKVTSMSVTRFHLKDKAVWEHIHKCRFWMVDPCYIIAFLRFKPFPQKKIIVVHQDCFLHAKASGAWWSARVWRTIHGVVFGFCPISLWGGPLGLSFPEVFSLVREALSHAVFWSVPRERQRAGAMEGKLQGARKSSTTYGLGWWLGDRRWTSRDLSYAFGSATHMHRGNHAIFP